MNQTTTQEKKIDSSPDSSLSPLAKRIYSVLKSGTPLYQVQGITKEKLENIYTTAYNLYNAGKYQKAINLFRMLAYYNQFDKRAWLGIAGSAEMLKDYYGAIAAYSSASFLDPEDPLPALHAFDCHFALKNYPQALSALEAVLLLSSKKTEYKEIRKRAEFLRTVLDSTIQESKAAA